MTTDAQIVEAQETGRKVAQARARGDEPLAQLLTRKLQESWPPHATPERRWLQATFDNAYRDFNRDRTL